MLMSRRLVAGAAAVGVLLAACGSGDDAVDGGATTTEFTLLATTTTTAPPATTVPATTSTTVPPQTTTTAPPTTTTTTVVAPTTTEANPAVDALVLTTIGIGSAEFGAEPEGVISYITSFLGAPTADTGWVDPFSIGPCSGKELRLVSWGVLTLQFGDVSNVVEGRRHFFAYGYGANGQIGAPPVGLETDRGITVGSRVVDLITAYPGVSLFPEDDFIAPNFYVNDNLRGFLTGLVDDDAVTVIFGGIGCGE